MTSAVALTIDNPHNVTRTTGDKDRLSYLLHTHVNV